MKKNKKLWIVVGLIILVIFMNQYKKEEKKIGTLSASLLMDTRVQEGNPTVIDGTSEVLGVIESGGPYDEHTYLQFSMAGITGDVTSAILTLSAWGGGINTIRVHQLYNSYAWSEATTNWNNRAVSGTNYGPIVGSALVDTIPGKIPITFDVTSIINNCYINSYITCSFIITASNDVWMGFDSKEDGAGTPPSLSVVVASQDSDGDGVPDSSDNCVNAPNPNQLDSDSDGIGDVCDYCPYDLLNDIDADEVCGNADNCPSIYNPLQEDSNSNGIGDACESTPGNLVTNPSFSDGGNYWRQSYQGSEANIGTSFSNIDYSIYKNSPSLRLEPDCITSGGDRSVWQSYRPTVTPGAQIKLSGWVRHSGCAGAPDAPCWVNPTMTSSLVGSCSDRDGAGPVVEQGPTRSGGWDDRGGARLGMDFRNSAGDIISDCFIIYDWTMPADTWAYLDETWAVPPNAADVIVWMQGFECNAPGIVWLDDVSLAIVNPSTYSQFLGFKDLYLNNGDFQTFIDSSNEWVIG